MPTISADRATAIRATTSRLILLTRADDRHMHAADVIERITALGFSVFISEDAVLVSSTNEGEEHLRARRVRSHTQWLLTLQACLARIEELASHVSAFDHDPDTEVST